MKMRLRTRVRLWTLKMLYSLKGMDIEANVKDTIGQKQEMTEEWAQTAIRTFKFFLKGDEKT